MKQAVIAALGGLLAGTLLAASPAIKPPDTLGAVTRWQSTG